VTNDEERVCMLLFENVAHVTVFCVAFVLTLVAMVTELLLLLVL